MFTQDPFQTSFGTLHSQFQNPGINPYATINPLAAVLGLQQTVPQFGQQLGPQFGQQLGYPQQQQVGAIQNPLVAAVLQNYLQNQIIAAALQQQQLQQQLQQNPLLNQLVAQQLNPFATQQYGHGQIGQPTGLLPQSWVGQGGQLGGTQAIGQINPLLAQLAARSIYGPTVPWGTY